jgi:mannose-6-phosphate isomerase-like protein (cupin superfamily)
VKVLCSIAAAGAALLTATSAAAADVAGPMRLSSAELSKMVAKTTDGLASSPLPLGAKGPVVIAAHRQKTGEVEVHDAMNDVFVAHSGRASVLVGGTVEGQRLTTPGEWRGGKITGAQTFQLAPGDVLWIPAGLPHQVIVPKGGEFTYMAFKSAK